MMWFYQMSTTVWDGARSRNNAYEVAVKRWRRLRKHALDARKLAADRSAADGAATSAKWAKAVSQRAAEDAASPYPNPFPIMIPNSAEDRAMLPVSKRAAADSQDRADAAERFALVAWKCAEDMLVRPGGSIRYGGPLAGRVAAAFVSAARAVNGPGRRLLSATWNSRRRVRARPGCRPLSPSSTERRRPRRTDPTSRPSRRSPARASSTPRTRISRAPA